MRLRRRVKVPKGPLATLRINDGDLVVIPGWWSDWDRDQFLAWLFKTGRRNCVIVTDGRSEVFRFGS